MGATLHADFRIKMNPGGRSETIKLRMSHLPAEHEEGVLVRIETENDTTAQRIQLPEWLNESILEDLPMVMSICDLNLRHIWVNRAFLMAFHTEKTTIFGKLMSEIDKLGSFNDYERLCRECIDTSTQQSETLHVYVLNRLLILEVVVSPILNSQGQTAYVVITSRDVTAKVKSQESRSAAQNLLNDIIEQMPIGFVAADIEFNILRMNASACHLFDYERESIIGEPLRILLASESEELKAEFIRQTLSRSKSAYSLHEGFDIHGVKRNGTHFPIKISSLKLSFGGFPLYCIMVLDMTDIHNALQRVIESEFSMRQMQKQEALGQLAGNVAHDFNNIMAIVMGYAENIAGQEDASELIRTMSREIRLAMQRGAGLTKQILAYAKHQNLEVKSKDMHNLMSENRSIMQAALSSRVKCVFDLEAVRTAVNIDEGQFMQVMLNLAVNARDAMPNGGEFHIATTNKFLDTDFFLGRSIKPQEGEYLYLTIRDNGTGIPTEILHRIFDPYFSTKPRDQGTGLGLSVAYGIIKQHGGLIFCDSEPGKGTRFEIFLRLTQAAEESTQSKPQGDTQVLAEIAQKTTILIVEDEQQLRALLARQLEKLGFVIYTAGNGREALEFVDGFDGNIDLVISDIMMPEVNGLEMAHEMVLLQPDLIFIFITGYSNDLFEKDGGLKSHRLIMKPFEQEQLLREISDVLAPTRSIATE